MGRLDVDELNLVLERAASLFGFSATARIEEDAVEFDAISWQKGGAIHHSVSCPIHQVQANPAEAARDFIESARAFLPCGTPKP